MSRTKNKMKSKKKSSPYYRDGAGYQLYDNDGIIQEPYMSAFQSNIYAKKRDVSTNFAYFTCVTLTSNSISQLPAVLTKKTRNKIWEAVEEMKYQWVFDLLDRPNRNQNIVDFLARWVSSIQQHGNAYIYKMRNLKGVVEQLFVLHPKTVSVLLADDGSVSYRITSNKILGTGNSIEVPASEIIHHRINCLFFDLIGVAPVHAAFIHSMQSIEMSETSYDFYKNLAQPSGILTAPESITADEAKRIKHDFESKKSMRHGSVVVLGDAMQYTPVSMSAHDQQLAQLMELNSKAICSCFHVPAYKVLGNAPTYQNVEALTLEYYNDALKFIISGIEYNLTDGLEIKDIFKENLWIKLDTEEFLRMDTTSRYKAYSDAIRGKWMTPNEARMKEDLEPIEGGDTIYLQDQDHSMQSIHDRDQNIPIQDQKKPQAPQQDLDNPEEKEDNEDMKNFLIELRKGF